MKKYILVLVAVILTAIVSIGLSFLFLKNPSNKNIGSFDVNIVSGVADKLNTPQACSIPKIENATGSTESYEKNGIVYVKKNGIDIVSFSSNKEQSLVSSRLSPNKRFVYILATDSRSGGYFGFIYDIDNKILNNVSNGDCGLDGARWMDDGNILLFGQGGYCGGGAYVSLDSSRPWVVGKIANGDATIPGSNFPETSSSLKDSIVKALNYENKLDSFKIDVVDSSLIRGQYHFKSGGGAIFIALKENENIKIIFEGNDLPLPCKVIEEYNLPESIRGQDCVEDGKIKK